jgi:hypothetical protein
VLSNCTPLINQFNTSVKYPSAVDRNHRALLGISAGPTVAEQTQKLGAVGGRLEQAAATFGNKSESLSERGDIIDSAPNSQTTWKILTAAVQAEVPTSQVATFDGSTTAHGDGLVLVRHVEFLEMDSCRTQRWAFGDGSRVI